MATANAKPTIQNPAPNPAPVALVPAARAVSALPVWRVRTGTAAPF